MTKEEFVAYTKEFGFPDAVAELPYPTFSYEAFMGFTRGSGQT